MVPTYRAARIVVECDPALREAVDAEAKAQSERARRRVTVSEVIRQLVNEHLLADDSKKPGESR